MNYRFYYSTIGYFGATRLSEACQWTVRDLVQDNGQLFDVDSDAIYENDPYGWRPLLKYCKLKLNYNFMLFSVLRGSNVGFSETDRV